MSNTIKVDVTADGPAADVGVSKGDVIEVRLIDSESLEIGRLKMTFVGAGTEFQLEYEGLPPDQTPDSGSS